MVIIGAGLIGTSIGLAATKNGLTCAFVDSNPRHQALATQLCGSGGSVFADEEVDLVVVSTTVPELANVVFDALNQYPRAIVIDIGSVKTKVLLEVSSKVPSNVLSRYLGTHPMAGREITGPEGARSDLFAGRAWAICPHEGSNQADVEIVEELIRSFGATAYQMKCEAHDEEVALVSHLPQLLASLLAGSLHGELFLAGQGLRDMVRIADSDPVLWSGILSGNQQAIKPLLRQISKQIDQLVDLNLSRESVERVIAAGVVGKSTIPGKHGGVDRDYAKLPVVISDKPGQLAALFAICGEIGVNIEDLSIE
ncbi:MAG: prephenate dehydrogenase/arogenate dehydrogenase family protein, partial [Actinobacteria bacterium]|nr:prephenate dehydrogenase/arogenate dehydrogenase family protein [Actinomycetota bacterium]